MQGSNRQIEEGGSEGADSGIMPGAEARRRPLRYKQYKRVRNAEAFAVRLGVGAANYAGRLDIANNANQALFLAHQRSVPMPQAIAVRPFDQPEDDPSNFAFYDAGLSDEPRKMVINAAHEFWADPGEFLQQVNAESHEFSTSDPRHAIAHELGELAMHQSVGWEAFTPGQHEYETKEADFQTDEEGLAHLYDVLGDRATRSHSEFVAELFAALLLGQTETLLQDEELMSRFRRYGGEALSHYFEG